MHSMQRVDGRAPSSIGRRERRGACVLVGLTAAGMLACSVTKQEPQPEERSFDIASGESHVGEALTFCASDETCEQGDVSGLACACSFCTAPCESVDECRRLFEALPDAGALDENLVCRQRPLMCVAPEDEDEDDGAGSGVCDVACTSDDACAMLGSAFRCEGGYCRQYSVELAAAKASLSCPEGMAGVLGSIDGAVESFCVDRFEVTVADYLACVEAGACEATTQGNAFEAQAEQFPIDFVLPDHAQAYCAFVNKALPLREQWQWAAQNGAVGTLFPWGDAAPDMSLSQVCALGTVQACNVGSHVAGNTSDGVADLAGNVGEWVVSGADLCAAGGDFTATATTDGGVGVDALQTNQCAPFDAPSERVGFRCVAPSE